MASREIESLTRPRHGLLSQAIIPSPTIQFALPARLRSKRHNDVVFVYGRSLRVREIILDAYLQDVMISSEFDANITAAKTVRIDQKSTELPDITLDIGKPQENEQDDDTLPSHLLVMTLDSRELIFLSCLASTPDKDPHLVHFRRALPSDVSLSERFGRHLAVDHRSRAVAVAAPSGFFGIFLLKSQKELQQQVLEGRLAPIAEERFYRLDGNILFMDFLHASDEESEKIVLLFIVAQDSQTYAVSYIWSTSTGLRQARPEISSQVLPGYCRLPDLLIPLTKTLSFLLVTSTCIVTVLNTLAHKPKILKHPCSDLNSTSPSVWTKWARPYRHAKYDKSHDDIFLCREDGRLTYVEIDKKGQIGYVNVIGPLGCQVETAFDTIDFSYPSHGGDVLVAAGNTGNGGLFIQLARQNPICVQRFVNWAPVYDAVVVPTLHMNSGHEPGVLNDISHNLQLYTCSPSSDNRGAVHEMRCGFEAQIGTIIPLDDFTAAQSIWVIAGPAQEGSYYLISDPISSVLMHLRRSEDDDSDEIYAVDETEIALDLSMHTMAAGHTSAGVVIQVTPKAVRSVLLNNPTLHFTRDFPSDHTVLAATVNEKLETVALVHRAELGIDLLVGKVVMDADCLDINFKSQTIHLEREPISIAVDTMKNATYVFLGTSLGSIVYYRIDEIELVYLGEYQLALPQEHISKAIESVVILDRVGMESAAIYCGLRSGLFISLDITFDPLELWQRSQNRLGRTAVKLLRKENSLLATCGTGFWCIADLDMGNASDFDIHRVWITDQNNPTYAQKSIEGFTFIQSDRSASGNTSVESLVCISDSQLLICGLDSRPKAVPRTIELPGPVNRIQYSQHLKCLVAAYITTETEKSTDYDTDISVVKRYMRPHLTFLNFDTSNSYLLAYQHNIETHDDIHSQGLVGSSGERITCILNWIPISGGQKYHLLVVGTARKTQHLKGRVLFLNARRNPANPEQIDCSVKYIHVFDGAVRAVAAYGDSTIIVAAGNDIIPIAPKLPNGGEQWATAARFKLTSPGVSITVRDSLLYISTARESLVILQIQNRKLELYAQAGMAHESLSHQYLGGENKLILASFRGGKVSIYSEAATTDMDNILSPAIAEAHLPVSIIRLNASQDSYPQIASSSSFSPSPIIYGTTIDGALYRFSVLSESEWRLLRFVQNLSSQDPVLSPFLSARKKRWTWVDIVPQEAKPSAMHVDGDILSRLLHKGAAYFREMLGRDQEMAESERSDEDVSAMLPKTHTQLFEDLFDDVFAQETFVAGDRIEHFMSWLRRLLRQCF